MNNLSAQISIQNHKIPRFFYGTAWKEDQTGELTFQALKAGFTAIDTANQRRHYYEEGVGFGLLKFLESKSKKREDLFLQTKYTFARGQDHRKPYDENDSISQQVADSFASSLEHLNTNYIDAYLLHGPSGAGIGQADLEAWAAMEKILESKKTNFIGISNVNAKQLAELCKQVKHKPSFVQNRCFALMGWDKEVREICKSENIIYQGFSLLTANSQQLASSFVAEIAKKYKKEIPQVIFRFCQQREMICLTGTSDVAHMQEDLNIYDFELTEAEVSQLENMNSGAMHG